MWPPLRLLLAWQLLRLPLLAAREPDADSVCEEEALPELKKGEHALLQQSLGHKGRIVLAPADSAEGQKSVVKGRHADQGERTDTKPLEFCDKDTLVQMHGVNHSADAFASAVLEDIENELARNSVDQMAKDIFSFYLCVRWVPDEVFWRVAKEELAAEIVKTVVEQHEQSSQAIGELYQNFKFVPLLCSRSVAVYKQRNATTNTYFASFERQIRELAAFLEGTAARPVWQGLRHADEAFCGSERMNSHGCDMALATGEWLNTITSWFGEAVKTDFATRSAGWETMQQVFASFKLRHSEPEWDADFLGWKARFPYHSFIAKPEGVSETASPRSAQRFMVCFGKRVASEMHRRPAGTNIITDQNSVGCHGWWDPTEVSGMLSRMSALWRPPTCQLAEKTYEMKKQILRMYTRMNEELFDALPSMLQDEEFFERGTLEEVLAGPPPYDVKSAVLAGQTYYAGMRVARVSDGTYTKADCPWWKPSSFCEISIGRGSAGSIVVANGVVKVKWDRDPEDVARDVTADMFQVVPQEYGHSTGSVLSTVGSALYTVGQGVVDMFSSLWSDRYSNLAEMMSGSLTKWVVCGVADNASYEELDAHLGTEDEAFQEHVREAYAKWTGYTKKVPGQECTQDPLVDQNEFPGCTVCEFSELHSDHPEAYWRQDGQKEEFMCPLVPPLSAVEQLQVFREKRQCLLHMTPEQQRHFQWHYYGHAPARKQNDKKANAPRAEYQMMKPLDIAQAAGPSQVSFGRSCTAEERRANPRFCDTPKLQQPWPTVEEMAGAVGAWLEGALGMPYGAIGDLIGNYQRIVTQNKSGSAVSRDAAVALGEQAWDGLLGIGRLAHSTAAASASELLYKLPGRDVRHARLERELFSFGHAGDVLHGASFQAALGRRNSTSNSRERYRRYAVVCDCSSFDPGLELALRWEWSELALRLMREAIHHGRGILDLPAPAVEARAEARLFYREKEEHLNSTHFTYGAAINPGLPSQSSAPPVQCRLEYGWLGGYCTPSDLCTRARFSSECVPKPAALQTQLQTEPQGWKAVWDQKLAKELGGQPIGQAELSTLKALTVRYHCGAKSSFGAEGGPRTPPTSLRECMRRGIAANAALKAAEPWRLYFPEEVIVVAVFGTLDQPECVSTDPSTRDLLCGGGAAETPGLDAHLGDDARSGGAAGGEYRGLRTGSGLPSGAVTEVVLRPEDILEVSELLVGG